MPWGPGRGRIYGQSYGGFCALSYLSFAPEGLREALITGGLAPLDGPADRVYQATFRRVAARNAEYFDCYPEDRPRSAGLPGTCADTEEYLPDGERLTVERFQMVGSFLGGNTRVDALHHLLEDAFVGTPGGERLSDAFLEQVRGLVSRSGEPAVRADARIHLRPGRGHGLGGACGCCRTSRSSGRTPPSRC